MHSIICATRGGVGSRAVEFAAIERAKKTGQALVFLYVIDTGGYGDLDDMMRPALRDELLWMGKTLLRIAERRAKAANLTAEIVIREGYAREEISQYAATTQAAVLMLGAPRFTTANIFGDDEIERFARSIRQSTGIPVEIIRAEGGSIPVEEP
jgi:nucleotide-binding universal stress UspA family protein